MTSKHLFAFSLGLLMLAGFCPAQAAEKRAVIFQRAPDAGESFKPGLDWPFQNYGIRADWFTGQDLDALAAALPGARLLVLYATSSAVFEHDAAAAGVSNLLASGGTVLFTVNGLPSPSREVAAFFKGIGVDFVAHTDLRDAPRYKLAINPGFDSPLLRTPHNLPANNPGQRLQAGDRWFGRVPEGMRVLMVQQDYPDRPAVLLREGVLGKGSLIVSRDLALGQMMNCAFRRQVVENLLTYCFGQLEQGTAVAGAAPPADASVSAAAPASGVSGGAGRRLAFAVDALNPLYARELAGKPWFDPGWKYRMPIIVHNPMARDFQRLPVVVRAAFPPDTAPSSFRVVSPYGEEVPSQAARADVSNAVYEISFLASFLELENRPFFIYFDDAARPAPVYDSELRIIQDARSLTLVNSRIKAKLLRNYPDLVHLEALAGSTGNQLIHEHALAAESLGARLVPPRGSNHTFQAVQVVEQGPVRTAIEYAGILNGKPAVARFALYAGQSRLAYSWHAPGQNVNLSAAWMPGLGRELESAPDRFFFPAPDGIRQLDVAEDTNLASLDAQTMAEGWYAFEDTATGQLCGELFDLAALRRLRIRVQGYVGLEATRTAFAAGPMQGAYVSLPDRSDLPAFRGQYLEFQQPPAVLTGAIQAREQAPAKWEKPVFGRNLVRAYHQNWSRKGLTEMEYYAPDDPQSYIPVWLRLARRAGANAIEFWSRGPVWNSKYYEGVRSGFLEELVRQAHAAGLFVGHGQAVHKNKSWYSRNAPADAFWHERYDKQYDLYAIRDTLADIAGEVGRAGADLFLLQDEQVYSIGHETSRQAFRAKYKMDPVEPVDVAKLAEPRHHLTARFQMDAYTEIIRGMAEAYRAQNPDGWLGDQVNVSAMVRVYAGAPHDWETHGKFLNTLSMDLYGKPQQQYKYFIKLMRATFDNDGPILIIAGGPMHRKHISANLCYHLMWGIDMLAVFPPRAFSEYDWFNEVNLLYKWLDFTGLGDQLAQYRPVPRIALLRDRTANLDCMTRGLWAVHGSDHDLRNQGLVFINNLQTDVVMAKNLTPATLKKYPVLTITSDPVLSDQLAGTVRDYIQGGGAAYIEGETINNRIIADLCGVAAAGALTNVRVECQAPSPFTFAGAMLPVEARGANVLASLSDGAPLLFERKVGGGKVLYCPLFLSGKAGSQDDLAGYFRQVFDGLAGKALVTLEDQNSNAIDSNLLTDGQRYLLAVYNNSFQPREIGLTWNEAQPPEMFCDFASGLTAEFNGAAVLKVPPFAVRFYYLGDRQTIVPPAMVPAGAAPVLGYSASPGQNIKDFSVPSEKHAGLAGPAAVARTKDPGYSYVAILSDQGQEGGKTALVTGDRGMFEALQDRKAIKVEFINRLDSGTLAFYDALIIPNIGINARPPVMRPGWEKVVRDYVAGGGALLACHHAVGFRPCEYAYLEEVAAPALDRTVAIQDIRITADHPVTSAASVLARFPEDARNPAFQAQLEATAFKPGDTFQTGFSDYVPLKAGASGTVLARGVVAGGADGNEPVLVVGMIGKGKVVVSGLALGVTIKQGRRIEHCAKPDANLLVNAVYWLTQPPGSGL